MMIRATEETPNIVCPYCGEELSENESYNLYFADNDIDQLRCKKCGKLFEIDTQIEITFSTYTFE